MDSGGEDGHGAGADLPVGSAEEPGGGSASCGEFIPQADRLVSYRIHIRPDQ